MRCSAVSTATSAIQRATRNEARLEKRSITISGHRTSLALEPEFWSALAEIAAVRPLSMTTLIVEIDRLRGDQNLASACRLAVLAHFRRNGAAT